MGLLSSLVLAGILFFSLICQPSEASGSESERIILKDALFVSA